MRAGIERVARFAAPGAIAGLNAGALVLAVAAFTYPFPDDDALGSRAASTSPQAPVVLQTIPPLGVFPETTARPVFARSRRPHATGPVFSADPGMPGKGAAEADGWIARARLRGVSIREDVRLASIAVGAGEPGDWIREGATIQGWTVSGIRPNAVLMTRGDRSVSLFLYGETKNDGGAGPSAPSPMGRFGASRDRGLIKADPGRPSKREVSVER